MITEHTSAMSDAELIEMARKLPPGRFVELLEQADNEARAARQRLHVLTQLGIERTDVTQQQMADALGVNRRTVYKRRERP